MNTLYRWLGKAAARTLKREVPTVIAVTGAVGKSTTKEMIGALFQGDSGKRSVRVSKRNYNNELGLPLTVFDADAPGRSFMGWFWLIINAWLNSVGVFKTCPDVFVFEMGADKPGDIKYLTEIAKPDVAVVTAILPEGGEFVPVHRANYTDVAEVIREKGELVRAMRSGGTAILNADDQAVIGMREETREHVLSFGKSEGADVRIMRSSIILEDGSHGKIPTGRRVEVRHWGRTYRFDFLGVFGAPIAYAAAATIAVAEATDAGPEAIRGLYNHFTPMPGRTRIIPGIKHTTLFDDSYNSSPAAVLSAVRDLTDMQLQPGQRRIVCLGEMREIGEESEQLHRKIASECVRMGVDFFIACGRFSHAMKSAALEAGLAESQIREFEDTPEAGRFLQNEIRPGDVILAKASEGTHKTKGVRMEQVVKELMAEPLRAHELLVRQGAAWKRK